MLPLIGLSLGLNAEQNFYQRRYYAEALAALGGCPVLLPLAAANPKALAQASVQHLAALVLTGGGDVTAAHFGEPKHPKSKPPDPARDLYEIELVLAAAQKGLPILGICRGMQVINIALGGDIYQDIPSQCPGALAHQQSQTMFETSHSVHLEPALQDICAASELQVNSGHHQSVRRLAPGLVAQAKAPDGCIEALMAALPAKILAVQWHPEYLWQSQAAQQKIFSWLLNSCR